MKLAISKQYQVFLREAGIAVEELFPGKGLDSFEETQEVSLVEFYQIVERFDSLVTEAEIRQLSQVDHMTMFVPTYLAALLSKNGKEALERFADYQSLVCPNLIQIEREKETWQVVVTSPLPHIPLTKYAILNTQLLLVNLLQAGTGRPIHPQTVVSPFDYDRETVQQFGIGKLEKGENRLIFSKKDLEIPFLTEDQRTWKILELGLKQQMEDLQGDYDFTNQLQKELFVAIPSGDFQIEEVAGRFGYSGRTLQRKLSKENTSYQEQLKVVQHSLAKSYLQLGYSTEKISELLGYSEVNAFIRAFKNWTGMTIGEYRRSLGLSG